MKGDCDKTSSCSEVNSARIGDPKLKVLLIKDGSLLDEDNLKLISEMAEEADAQLWIERVGIDSNTTVIMEDGNCKDC